MFALQHLRANDGLLVVAQLAGAEAGDGWTSEEDVLNLFIRLRIPAPVYVRRSFGQLRSGGYVLQHPASEKWSLTPAGAHRVAESVGELSRDAAAAELAGLTGADFGHVRHTLVPPALAPVRWGDNIRQLLDRFSFDSNVFLMTRFPSDEGEAVVDPIAKAVTALRNVADAHGMNLHLASDRQIADDLWGNVVGYMWACRYGIGILESRGLGADELNDNVLIELGAMLTLGRRCMLLRDRDAPQPPTDFVGQIYKPVDIGDVAAVGALAHHWFAEDLGLGPCGICR